MPPKKQKTPSLRTSSAEVSEANDIAGFLDRAAQLKGLGEGRGGLIFALDATMSRQHTWDEAQHIQSQMFDEVGSVGGLDIQLVYFRGFNECRASRWVSDTTALRDLMNTIDCRGGQTQIAKVLGHARKEAGKKNPGNPNRSRVDALIYVGDALEENVDALCHKAGQLALLGVPCFMFQEGNDVEAERGYREIARLTNGAFIRFGPGAAARLADLLKAVARFVAGGTAALEADGSREARLLLEQMK